MEEEGNLLLILTVIKFYSFKCYVLLFARIRLEVLQQLHSLEMFKVGAEWFFPAHCRHQIAIFAVCLMNNSVTVQQHCHCDAINSDPVTVNWFYTFIVKAWTKRITLCIIKLTEILEFSSYWRIDFFLKALILVKTQ